MRRVLFKIEQFLVMWGAACHFALFYFVMGIFAVGVDHVFMNGTRTTPEMMKEIRVGFIWTSPFIAFFWIWWFKTSRESTTIEAQPSSQL